MDIGNIHWASLSYALDYYQAAGYKYVEVPWIVPNSVSMLTCPSEDLLMKIAGTNTSLVGSAEQSLLKMEFDGKLPKGKYVACSPCFRVENSNDGLHYPTFMKVELYRTDRTDSEAMYDIIKAAERFIQTCIKTTSFGSKDVKRLITPQGIDLMVNDIEVGSYGIRSFGSFSWVYGTGLAQPRLLQAVNADA